jgi:hypothetical protein
MTKALAITVSLFFITSFFVACSKDDDNGGTLDCTTITNKAFAADVNPIIQNFCNTAGCHASGSFNGPGALTNYTEVFNARALIRPAIASGRMPQTGTLTTAQKNSILCWIDSGAPNN